MPAAEVEVSAGLVRRLLAAEHPDLAQLPVTVLANGWDNVLCRIGPDLIARLPRRGAAVPLIEHELTWLPVLAPRLPLPVPAPVRAGQPGAGYPWPWSIVPFLPGRAASLEPPADPQDAAVCLGRFLAALHTPAPPDAPANPSRGIPLAGRHETVIQNMDALADRVDRVAVLAAWEAALAAPAWAGPPVWLHGDLHPANILVHHGRLSGVIDFGDITAGDPAADLSVAWMLLPVEQHGAFRAAYAAASQHAAPGSLWDRARGWALVLGLVFLAHSDDNPELFAAGQRTLGAVLG
jgi:aminoglycoside phosphotransferase (APT) family kinase protein